MKNNKEIVIYTDGACKGNPGIGGWGALIKYDGSEREIKGCILDTTNNKMELIAVIESLNFIENVKNVKIITDSKYVKNGICDWIFKWKKNGWMTASKKPVKNRGLWEELDNLVQIYNVTWEWVKGHAGDPGNERADQLANEAIVESLTKY